VIKLQDTVCTSCGAELEFPETAIASEWALMRRGAA
jgi:hypothetical protein